MLTELKKHRGVTTWGPPHERTALAPPLAQLVQPNGGSCIRRERCWGSATSSNWQSQSTLRPRLLTTLHPQLP
eukprot:800098-Amphidinium_carterae.1